MRRLPQPGEWYVHQLRGDHLYIRVIKVEKSNRDCYDVKSINYVDDGLSRVFFPMNNWWWPNKGWGFKGVKRIRNPVEIARIVLQLSSYSPQP